MPVHPLNFWGEQDRPQALADVFARRPLLGSGERPPELLDLAGRRSFYLPSYRGDQPSVAVERTAEDDGLWRVDVPMNDRLLGARPGRSARREPAEGFLAAVDERVAFTSFRPDWTDALYVPRRVAPTEVPRLRRFDGRGVRPLFVFGNDDRWAFQDASWPWGLAGRVFNSSGYSGTGALVGDRLVVTAGHMVPWDDDPWWMLFVPAYFDGASLHGAGVQSYVSDARGYDVNGDVTGYDWAVLRLYQPLGSLLGYYGFNGYSSSWNNQPWWSIVGYPGAVANAQRPSFQGGITVNDTDSDSNGGEEIESQTADLTPGNSGGPMFGWWSGDPRIVGVVSGEEEDYSFPFSFDDENVMAGGSGFTNLVAWGRTNWPA
jgi:V8-like Glu-specific endopeptidase